MARSCIINRSTAVHIKYMRSPTKRLLFLSNYEPTVKFFLPYRNILTGHYDDSYFKQSNFTSNPQGVEFQIFP